MFEQEKATYIVSLVNNKIFKRVFFIKSSFSLLQFCSHSGNFFSPVLKIPCLSDWTRAIAEVALRRRKKKEKMGEVID